MKECSMILKTIPPNYYKGVFETIFCLSPNRVYLVKQVDLKKNYMKYFFRLPTKFQTYESLVTENFYESVIRNTDFKPEEIISRASYKYLYGKDTITVFSEYETDYKNNISRSIIATGPEENKEWQYDFHKFHI